MQAGALPLSVSEVRNPIEDGGRRSRLTFPLSLLIEIKASVTMISRLSTQGRWTSKLPLLARRLLS